MERCPYCSFDPTSMSDYCDKHRPKFPKATKEDMRHVTVVFMCDAYRQSQHSRSDEYSLMGIMSDVLASLERAGYTAPTTEDE